MFEILGAIVDVATIAVARAARLGMLRVGDESGEDYLYPADRFAALSVPPSIAKALSQ